MTGSMGRSWQRKAWLATRSWQHRSGSRLGAHHQQHVPPLAPSSLCSSWDVAEQSGSEEEQGHSHASSLVSVYHDGERGCSAGGMGGSPGALSTLSYLSSTQEQFDGRAQDPRECPVPKPRQPRTASLEAEGSGGWKRQVLGSDAWAAPAGQRLSAVSQLRHWQGLSLQQRDWGTALDLSRLSR